MTSTSGARGVRATPGVVRHVDAGYDTADTIAAERGVRIPMPKATHKCSS